MAESWNRSTTRVSKAWLAVPGSNVSVKGLLATPRPDFASPMTFGRTTAKQGPYSSCVTPSESQDVEFAQAMKQAADSFSVAKSVLEQLHHGLDAACTSKPTGLLYSSPDVADLTLQLARAASKVSRTILPALTKLATSMSQWCDDPKCEELCIACQVAAAELLHQEAALVPDKHSILQKASELAAVTCVKEEDGSCVVQTCSPSSNQAAVLGSSLSHCLLTLEKAMLGLHNSCKVLLGPGAMPSATFSTNVLILDADQPNILMDGSNDSCSNIDDLLDHLCQQCDSFVDVCGPKIGQLLAFEKIAASLQASIEEQRGYELVEAATLLLQHEQQQQKWQQQQQKWQRRMAAVGNLLGRATAGVATLCSRLAALGPKEIVIVAAAVTGISLTFYQIVMWAQAGAKVPGQTLAPHSRGAGQAILQGIDPPGSSHVSSNHSVVDTDKVNLQHGTKMWSGDAIFNGMALKSPAGIQDAILQLWESFWVEMAPVP